MPHSRSSGQDCFNPNEPEHHHDAITIIRVVPRKPVYPPPTVPCTAFPTSIPSLGQGKLGDPRSHTRTHYLLNLAVSIHWHDTAQACTWSAPYVHGVQHGRTTALVQHHTGIT